jgi:hypothetical protein
MQDSIHTPEQIGEGHLSMEKDIDATAERIAKSHLLR